MASRTRRFFLNMLSLTATALIMRGVGVAFNVYVSNRAGAEVMGLYSLLFGAYGLFITLGAAGINLGCTRLVSDALGKGDKALAIHSVKRSLLYCTVTGAVSGAIMFSLSGVIGEKLLGDIRTVSSIKVLAFTLLPISVCSCLSGYFTAVRRVKINAASQILIQLAKICVTTLLLGIMLPRGVEYACLALVIGGAVTELISLAVSLSLYLHDRHKYLPKTSGGETDDNEQGKITKKLVGITLPVTFSACIRSGLTTLQHALIPRGLKANGATWQAALSSYGTIHSMALPIVLFPSAFISSFAGLLIPEVAECRMRGDRERLSRIAYRILTLSLIFSIGVAGIMIFLSTDLGLIIYNSSETSLYIRMLAPLIPIMYIDSAVDAILKGMGHQVYSMNVNIADALTACILVFFLVPRIGLYGYIISIYATEILNTTLSLIKMIEITSLKPKIFHQVIMPTLCIIASTFISNLILTHTKRIFPSAVELSLHVILVLVIYVIFLVLTKTVGRDENEVIYASLLSEKQYREKFKVGNK